MLSISAFLSTLSSQEQIIFYGLVTIIVVLIIWAIVKKLFKLVFFIALGVAILYFVLLYLGKKSEAEYVKDQALQTVNQVKEKLPEVVNKVKNTDLIKDTINSVKENIKDSVTEVVKEQLSK